MLLLWSSTPVFFSGGYNVSYASNPINNSDDDIFLAAWFLFITGAYE